MSTAPSPEPRIAVVLPCYRVTRSILAVLADIGPWASAVYCVDDACPDQSGEFVRAHTTDPRVRVIRRQRNGGVGAATMTGYAAAMADGADILIKIDGDGQMDPTLAPLLARPIALGQADYVKGNRFFSPLTVAGMPPVRLLGNAGLSFFTKLSTGYWDLFDPTNGFTALHASVAAQLPFDRVHPRYFFESDLLFRLGVLGAKVVELPLVAVYADEQSHLSASRSLLTFPFLHARNLGKRVIYNYFLRNFSVASTNLLAGTALTVFGGLFGVGAWVRGYLEGNPATAGTVMLAGLPVLLGLQLLLSFVHHDIAATPREPLHPRIARVKVLGVLRRTRPRSWLQRLRHVRERRAALRNQVDAFGAFQAWEETCVPSYLHPNRAAAMMSWWRLFAAVDLAGRHTAWAGPVLDFGSSVGELGHLVPERAPYWFVEQQDNAAEVLQANLPEARRTTLEDAPDGTFAVVFALDSLEHNTDFGALLDRLAAKLAPGGILVMSGPTESRLYRLGRRIAGFDSHYHETNIWAIEAHAAKSYRLVARRSLPPLAALFSISVWARSGDHEHRDGR